MNTKLVSISNHLFKTLAAGFSALVLAALLVTASGSSRAATSTTIRYNGHDFEGRQSFQIEWPAFSNATYLVQSATDLAAADAWQTMDLVTPTNEAGQYDVKAGGTAAEFFRLVLPQPHISSVEPAIIAPGVPVNFYVIGQCFDTNGVLQINGVTQSGTVYQSSTTLVQPSFTPDVPGTYQFSFVVSGQVVSSFNVVCADALANPEQVLQGPPDEPPASPSKKDFKGHVTLLKAFDNGSDDIQEGKKDFKGHVTLLKAFDNEDGDASSARGHTKTGHVTLMKAFDDESDNTSARGHTKTGHVTLMKAFDDGSDDIQEGKKGLNAVNVKLARMAGGGGGGGGGGTASRHKNSGHSSESLETVLEQIPFSGEVQECDVDIIIPGRGLDFVWARMYHSRIHHTATILGNCWSLSYDVSVEQGSSGITVNDGTGRRDLYTLGTNGVYTCPEFFREGTISNNTFTLTFADTGQWMFNPFDGTATAGKLIQIITRNGDTMTLGYDTSGRLAQVVDDLGRTNTVAYNSAGQVSSVTDFTGRSVTYQYYQGLKADNGGAGDLKSVTSPPVTGTPDGNDFHDGKTTTYTYSTGYANDAENHLLLSVIDAKGQTAYTHVYQHNQTDLEFLHCIASQEGTNTPAVFTYLPQTPAPSNHFAALRCVMNEPVGNVTECFTDARGRCVMVRDYTGRATPEVPVTDTVNRPTGKLRSSDPDYYEARWSWNNDSLCTAEISPGGQQLCCMYQSDFDPATSARKRADCRVVRELASSPVDLDGDGVADVTDRSWHFDYDPRFGSDPTPSYGKKLYVGNLPFRESPTEPSRGMLHESPTKSSLRESPTLSRWRESPTLSHLRESPTKQSLAIRESPTKQSLRESPTLSHLRESPTKSSLRESPTLPSLGQTALRESPSKASLGRTAFRESPTLPSLGFCTSATDPRGNVTTIGYDASGNATSKVRLTKDWSNTPEWYHWREGYAYNNHGQLTAITNAPDANGYRRKDMLIWSQGQVTQCVGDAGGLALAYAFEYDLRGNLTRYVDPRTNDWLYTYNALNQCVRVQSPPNISPRCATDYFYDANDNLVSCATQLRDASDNLVGTQVDRASYDGLDRLTEIALAVDATHALTNHFVYDGNDQCVQVLGGDAVSGADPHQTVAYEYDERGLLFREIGAPGSGNSPTNEFAYDPNGQTARVNKVEAVVLKQKTFAYDGFGRLASATDEMGNQTICFYDANDNPKVVRLFGELNDVPGSAGNIRLAESHYEYDGLDRCVRTHELFFDPATQSPIGSGQAMTTFAYAPNDECVSVTDTLGHTTSFGYDTACRPVSVTDALGNQQSVVYDAGGNPLVEISSELPAAGGKPQVFSVTNVYDPLNRCVSSIDSAGNTSSYAYDSLDRCVQTMNPRGTLEFYSYDLLNRCTLAISDLDQDGQPDFTGDITTTFTWSSSSGNLLAVTDSNTNMTSYAYDSLGRCLTVTHADGTQEQMTWSPRSNLIGEQDANGTTITNVYDLCDRIIHRDIAARTAAGVAATTTFETFTYDGCDRLTGAANDSGSSAFTYDSLDDCVSETLNGLTTTSTYDALGNRLSLTYPGGRALVYTYDALNRCASITDSGQQLVSYAYDGPEPRLADYLRQWHAHPD